MKTLSLNCVQKDFCVIQRVYKHLIYYSVTFFVALFLTLILYQSQVLQKVEYITYDWRVKSLASSKVKSKDIVLIVIDQYSLEWMQKEQGLGWPWPREFYGVFTAFAKEADAKLLVFDMIFSENSVYNISDDIAFSQALQTFPTIGAIALSYDKHSHDALPKYLNKLNIQECIPSTLNTKIVLPVQEIAKGFSSFGVANALPDSDSIIRRVNLCHAINNIGLPSLALSAHMYLYPDAYEIKSKEVFIGYHDAPFSYTSYNAASIIQSYSALQNGEEPTINPSLLKDKVIFLGVSAAGLFDQKASPLSKNHSGVDIQATIFDNLVLNSFIEPLKFVYELFYLLLFGLITSLLMMYSKKASHFIVPTILIPLIIFGLGYLYYFYNIWLNITLLLSNVLILVMFTGILGYLLEGRQKRYLKTAFSQYVSPSIVNKLVENPDLLKLGGESRELSIFFSDIEGFTSIAEKLEPPMLIEMLHEYLDNLSTIIMENKGTIDKYEGDAIIAFWNAPLDTQGHEQLAVQSALDCQRKISQLNPIFLEKYGVELKTRIGIHTGKVIVGNLGSTKHFDYSFIGDAGNLAARLEGVNKIFGTKVLISKYTREKITQITCRKIATIQVVGRKQAVTVYEPLINELDAKHSSLWEEALVLFENMKFEEARKIFLSLCDRDKTANSYLDIIEKIENKELFVTKGVISLKNK